MGESREIRAPGSGSGHSHGSRTLQAVCTVTPTHLDPLFTPPSPTTYWLLCHKTCVSAEAQNRISCAHREQPSFVHWETRRVMDRPRAPGAKPGESRVGCVGGAGPGGASHLPTSAVVGAPNFPAFCSRGQIPGTASAPNVTEGKWKGNRTSCPLCVSEMEFGGLPCTPLGLRSRR